MVSVNLTCQPADQISRQAKQLLRYALATALASGMTLAASGQTFSEWFAQKKTQKKYLIEQVTALKVYGTYLKKGYDVARNGLGSISDYLSEERRLHQDYYDRLLRANPAVQHDSQVQEILQRQQDILQDLQFPDLSGIMSTTETQYLQQVRSAVLSNCKALLDDLDDLISDGQLNATDAARLKGVNAVYSGMLANYRFSDSFRRQVLQLIVRRRKAIAEVAASRQLHGLH
jgi:hypothetical protein